LVEAYCVKCKEKRTMDQAAPFYTENGAPATRGICPVCGGKIVRMGRTPEHEGLPVPPKPKKQVNSRKRSGKLVVVESPAKARTVSRYLGKGYKVKASVGHVRDLLRSQLSVDVDNDFAPKYRVPNEKRSVVKEIKDLARTAEAIYLATDPDREGEAIAWHLSEAAEIDPQITHRVVFHEITKPAVEEAFSHPRPINGDLVNAQQARRVLDRLVGYNLSPLLWQKVRSRLSAGRVQSVALRMIVDREKEIEAFVAEEYWTIQAELHPQGKPSESYIARLVRINGDEPNLPHEEAVKPLLTDLEFASYTIDKIKRGERKRKPAAPFTTSTLQQDASRRLGFTTKKTMALAQQLYEGVDIGNGGSTGLITYMRTDSTNVSTSAQQEARTYIQERFGKDFLPAEAPVYKTKAKGAQEAHEAIRPTSVMRAPETIQSRLSRDQFRLYQLVWKRFVASQMEAAVYDTLAVDILAQGATQKYMLRVAGSTVRFQGFLAVYEEAMDEDQLSENGEGVRIPASLAEGQEQTLLRLIPEQRFTQPPPRYTEASLVRALEENGIGRPSTYAPTLTTLQQRGYVLREAKRLLPTETGEVVNELLTSHFPDVVDISFTARMEEDLDLVASGERHWVDIIRDFYGPFSMEVDRARAEMPEVKSELEVIGRPCPECGHELAIRYGRFGKFISCSNFPTCRYTEPWLEKIGVPCPKDGGELVERKTRRGRTFFGCTNYPECDFTSWKRPLPTACPVCKGMLVIANKNQAQCLNCENMFPLEQVQQEVDEMA
jgi:DNA topoisomerase I